VADARLLLVTGPRMDAWSLPDVEGMEKVGFVPDLYRHLACCDAAVVQDGLAKTLELVALGRPFVYFPLRHHWEQQHFVTHRLTHHRAGLAMDYATTSAEDLARALPTALDRGGARAGYRRIAKDGAERAADQLVPLLAAAR
jgi:UDP:flavonoid glycosyltransferase YjiC (YdhE family)